MSDDFGIVCNPFFDEDGKLTVEIPDDMPPEEARFNRTNLSSKDLCEAHSYLLEFSEVSSPNLRRAVLVAAIVAYARPFKRNHDGGTGHAAERLQVNLESLLTPEEQALHNRIVDLRDKAIAHSDFSFGPTGRVRRGVPHLGSGFSTWTIAFDVLVIEPEVQRLTELAKKMERYCIDELFRLSEALSAQDATN